MHPTRCQYFASKLHLYFHIICCKQCKHLMGQCYPHLWWYFDSTNLSRACASKTLPYCWKELFCKLVFCFLSQSCDYFVSKCWFLCQNCVKLWNLWPSNFCVYHLQLGSLTLTGMTPAQMPRNKKTWDEMSLTLTSMWPLFQIYYLAQHVIELFFVFIGSLWKRER